MIYFGGRNAAEKEDNEGKLDAMDDNMFRLEKALSNLDEAIEALKGAGF